MDKYQGQQNDYILLSLVKTRAVGHIRDVRRLVVAMSRARLGLYVFGRQALFSNCYELQPSLSLLLQRPTVPALHPHEHVQVCSLLTCSFPEERGSVLALCELDIVWLCCGLP